MMSMKDGLFIGADGCRGGWIACILDHGELYLERYDTVELLINRYPEFDGFLIDMAIGLRNRADQLRPDDMARKELKSHSSTIFPIPCRQAVYAESEEKQKQENIRVLGKSLSKQSVAIIPKIREIDEFMDDHPEYRNRILESHPELDFARLKGRALTSRKKGYEGFSERADILERYLPGQPLHSLFEKAKEYKCNPDDLLDAICLAVTAALSAEGMCDTIPEDPELDDNGLYMKLTIPGADLMRPEEQEKVAVVTGGVNGIGKCIAEEFRKQGVKVYVIDKAEGDHYVGDISRKEVLEDFARMVLFLCSDKAGFITGENICIDGGMTRLMIYHEDHGWTYNPTPF